MRKWLISILMIGLIALVACGTDEETETQTQTDDSDQENTTDVETLAENLSVESEVKTENKEASIRFSLTNEGEEAIELGFASGQQFDVHIANENGENVYTYSADRSFTQEQTTEELDAGGTIENAVQWDENVEPGEYEATVTFLVDTINGEDVSDRDFKATSSFPIEATEESSTDGSESDSGEETDEESNSDNGESTDTAEETTSIEGNEAFRSLELSGENGDYKIAGEARVFEGTFLYRVEDGHNELVSETPVQVDSGAPNWSQFELDISIPESELPDFGTLTLMLYENSAEDGEPTNVNYVPLEQFSGE